MNAKDGEYPNQELTGAIIGAALDVFHDLGSGFLEKVYENALAVELRERGLDVVPQAEMRVLYKGQVVGIYYADLLVNGAVVCELEGS
jgi:GxxExxY protein